MFVVHNGNGPDFDLDHRGELDNWTYYCLHRDIDEFARHHRNRVSHRMWDWLCYYDIDTIKSEGYGEPDQEKRELTPKQLAVAAAIEADHERIISDYQEWSSSVRNPFVDGE
jgi:hypothetical protein